MDITQESFLAELIDRASKRFVATVLGEFEAYTGGKDRRISQLVKDFAGANQRGLYRALTGTEVESKHEG
jgi:hypothetical protein